jgi:molybdopterin molybdotransferase
VISVETALEMILNNIHRLEAEECPLLESLGLVTAEDVYSEINVPPKDNSALDGYAVRSIDIEGASLNKPRILNVIDMVVAGDNPHKKVERGTAVRIMTGAPTPEGADCVVGFEYTDEIERFKSQEKTPSEIGIIIDVPKGANIRKAGESIKQGNLIIAKGTVIRPSEIGVLASIGYVKIKVIRRPVVAILATGDELINPGEPLTEGKIYNSNTYSVAAQVLREGGMPRILGIALDNEPSVENKINQALEADLLITIGGVSMGDYDVVKNVLEKQGNMVFWKVRTKPGKPLAFGTIHRINKDNKSQELPHLGLAGNSVSCMVNYELFARPAILKMMGKTNLAKPTIDAIMQESISNDDGRRVFARVIVEKQNDKYYARLTGPQGSGVLTSMVMANGLAIVPENKLMLNKGDIVQVLMLDWKQDI